MTYPPTYKECKTLFEELKQLDATSSAEFNPRKYEIIHDLAEAHFYEARPYFVAGLEHLDPDYRWACISALATHWQDQGTEVISKLTDMAKSDSDTQVRIIAIDSLKNLKIREAIPLLTQIIESGDEDEAVVEAARESYWSLHNRSSE